MKYSFTKRMNTVDFETKTPNNIKFYHAKNILDVKNYNVLNI